MMKLLVFTLMSQIKIKTLIQEFKGQFIKTLFTASDIFYKYKTTEVSP